MSRAEASEKPPYPWNLPLLRAKKAQDTGDKTDPNMDICRVNRAVYVNLMFGSCSEPVRTGKDVNVRYEIRYIVASRLLL